VNLKVIGSSPAVDHAGVPGLAQTAYYVAPSGALVFAAGTIDWTFALDDYRLFANPRCLGRTQVIPGLQRLTSNVMAALIVHDQHCYQRQQRYQRATVNPAAAHRWARPRAHSAYAADRVLGAIKPRGE
jgi:hypothetical protein